MIAETLAGIALVKQSVDFIKSNISTVQDIGQIASQIDDLFRGEKEIQKQRSKKSGSGLTDQFGVQSVAQETIDAKLAQEKMQEVSMMIDMRFGPGTWKGIVDERARRIQEAKEAALKARRQAIQEHNEFMESVKMFLVVGGVILVAIALLVGVMVSASASLM